jgi:hypothetical protein
MRLVAPFHAMLAKHVNTCYMNVFKYLMINRVKIHFGSLGFEVFELKMPFLQVLDCHNSSGRARTRHGELDHRTHGLLASNSPPTRHGELTAPKRVVGSFQAVLGSFVSDFLCDVFIKVNPSN